MSAEEARLAARREFGGVDQAKAVQRDARSFLWLDDARRDMGYAARMLRRSPGFTAVAVVTLALGIGAVTIIYSVVRNVLLDPFPYAHSQRMVDVIVRDASNRILRGALPSPEFLDYQEQAEVFEDVIGANSQSMHFVSDAGAERLTVSWVTPNTFAFLGVGPFIGRHFGPADAAPDAPRVAVLNHRTWMTLFGGDRSIVDRAVVLNDEPRTIIGVMPPRFEWHVADLWIPGPLDRNDDPREVRGARWFQARLRPGVTVEQAEAQIAVVAARRAALHPQDYPPHSRIQVITVIDWVVGRFRGVLYTLFGAVGLLLVIACCNVANMLLSRATVREQEMSVRAALGASRARIVRQLLVESLALAMGGVAGGCLLAYGGIAVLARFMPRQGVAWETQLRLDQPVLYFALATAAVATIAFGLFPALYSARRDLVAGANSSGRSGIAARRHRRMRNALVVAEVALSIVLLMGAGLLVRSFANLTAVDIGFEPRNLLGLRIAFPPGQYTSSVERHRFYRASVDRVERIAGVQSAAVAFAWFGGLGSPVEIPGTPLEGNPAAAVQFISEEYFATLGLPLIAGRPMSAADVDSSRKVALVNEALVKRYFAGQNPIGRTMRLARLATFAPPVEEPTFEIIGVARDSMNAGIRDAAVPQVYLPFSVGPPSLMLLLRTAIEPMQALNAVRQEIRAVDPQVALVGAEPMESVLDRGYYAQPRFALLVLVMFSSTALVLVVLGVYGVMAYTVSQQSRDIAIRMALGGGQGHVVQMVLRTGLQLLIVGLVTGVLASFATNQLLVDQLWNTSARDPVTLAAAVSLVIVSGLIACWIPARRATRVDPIAALRD